MSSPTPADHRPLLAAQTDEAILFTFGLLCGRPLRSSEAGRLAALWTELNRRGLADLLMAQLDPDLQGQIGMLIVADRGQHFSAHGQRRLV